MYAGNGPTSNYAVVHVDGIAKVIEDAPVPSSGSALTDTDLRSDHAESRESGVLRAA